MKETNTGNPTPQIILGKSESTIPATHVEKNMKNTAATEGADAASASAIRGMVVMVGSFCNAFHVVSALTSPNEIHVAEGLALFVAIALAVAWLLVFKPQTRAMRNLARLFQFCVFTCRVAAVLHGFLPDDLLWAAVLAQPLLHHMLPLSLAEHIASALWTLAGVALVTCNHAPDEETTVPFMLGASLVLL